MPGGIGYMCYSKSLLKVHAPSSALNDNALGSDV